MSDLKNTYRKALSLLRGSKERKRSDVRGRATG